MSTPSLSQAVEDYLKAVYRLGSAGKPVGTNKLAEALAVQPASVTGMLKRLSKDGYVDYAPRQGAELTAKGLEVALEIIRHHRLLESFFVRRLGMDWAQAHREAETLEHYISEELETIIDTEMGHPEADPQGSPIPTPSGEMRERDWPTLDRVGPGEHCLVRRVQHAGPDMLRHIEQLGLVPGATVRVRGAAPFDGPVEVRVDGRVLFLGRRVASVIQVERQPRAASRAKGAKRRSAAAAPAGRKRGAP
jgi:DtxR family Mn-dependent transcriptional regulator